MGPSGQVPRIRIVISRAGLCWGLPFEGNHHVCIYVYTHINQVLSDIRTR